MGPFPDLCGVRRSLYPKGEDRRELCDFGTKRTKFVSRLRRRMCAVQVTSMQGSTHKTHPTARWRLVLLVQTADEPQCLLWVCAVQRRRFPVGASPTRQSLQPEAIGAVMEVTKWLKPSISASRIGDGASVQAATRVNAEQSSKRTMRRSTRQPYRGRLIRLDENERNDTFRRCAGVVAAACTQGKRTQHGKPQGVVSDDQPEAREGQAGVLGCGEAGSTAEAG